MRQILRNFICLAGLMVFGGAISLMNSFSSEVQAFENKGFEKFRGINLPGLGAHQSELIPYVRQYITSDPTLGCFFDVPPGFRFIIEVVSFTWPGMPLETSRLSIGLLGSIEGISY